MQGNLDDFEEKYFSEKSAPIIGSRPINREIDIASVVADGPQSVILQQITNGVAIRMAILELLLAIK